MTGGYLAVKEVSLLTRKQEVNALGAAKPRYKRISIDFNEYQVKQDSSIRANCNSFSNIINSSSSRYMCSLTKHDLRRIVTSRGMQILCNKRHPKQKFQFSLTIVDSEKDLIQMRDAHPSHRHNPICQESRPIEEFKHSP
jgi:hypothetical protein